MENQYKVLFLATYTIDESCQVFTLEDPTAKQWRDIQGVGPHLTLGGEVCIKGTIYYREEAERIDNSILKNIKLMSFDVRSDKFYHVEAPKTLMHYYHSTLINYQGKLGFICLERGVEIWVMERQRWSKIFFREMDGFQEWRVSGVTHGGEIVFVKSRHFSYDMLRVYYYDLKQNSIRYVDLESCYTKEGSRKRNMSKDLPTYVLTVPDHVENTMSLNQTCS